VSPVVGKMLAAGLAVLYIASATGFLLGGVVPDYRTATGSELGERVLATAATELDQSIPATESRVDVRTRLELPRTIRGETYSIRVRERTLHLSHPDDRVSARARLSVPSHVTVGDPVWRSGDPLLIRVSGPRSNRTLGLEEAP
jgi:hypothetical protein